MNIYEITFSPTGGTCPSPAAGAKWKCACPTTWGASC